MSQYYYSDSDRSRSESTDSSRVNVNCYSSKQKPFIRPLPYLHESSTSTSGRNPNNGYRWVTHNRVCMMNYGDQFSEIENKSLSNLDDELRILDSFFEDWYERKQAYALLQNAGKEILEFMVNFKNPRYWKKKKRDVSLSTLPSAWLAYQFGIKPLMGTIDRSLDILGDGFPDVFVSGTSGGRVFEKDVYKGRTDEITRYINHNAIIKTGCRVTGINPNSGLLGATGLNEPLSSAWNVIPWGWAVDYFVNVGDLLSNFENNHPGLLVSDYYVSRFIRSHVNAERQSNYLDFVNHASGDVVYLNRSLGRPSYRIDFRVPQLGSNRTANLFSAIALTAKGAKK